MSRSDRGAQPAATLSAPAPTRIDTIQSSVQTAASLMVGTLVASPVIVAALAGRQDPVVALAMYMAALVASWVAIGLFLGAFALAGSSRAAVAAVEERESAPEPKAQAEPTTPSTVSPTADPDLAATSR